MNAWSEDGKEKEEKIKYLVEEVELFIIQDWQKVSLVLHRKKRKLKLSLKVNKILTKSDRDQFVASWKEGSENVA